METNLHNLLLSSSLQPNIDSLCIVPASLCPKADFFKANYYMVLSHQSFHPQCLQGIRQSGKCILANVTKIFIHKNNLQHKDTQL